MRANVRDTQSNTKAHSQIDLLVNVQCADGVVLPAGCDLAAVAGQAFEIIQRNDYAQTFVANAAGSRESELCIRLVDAAEGEALNSQWRGKDAATNVLSFTADIVTGDCAPLGDLVLCAPVIENEAQEQDKASGDHYSHLLVHGVLHLLGYDHVVETEAEAMERIEVAVLGELGIENPYE